MIKRSDLCIYLRDQKVINRPNQECRDILYEYVRNKFNLQDPPKCLREELLQSLLSFFKVLKRNWVQCNRSFTNLQWKHKKWLDQEIEISNFALPALNWPSTSFGRPSKGFDECGPKSKRRKVEPLLGQWSARELCYAAEQKLRQSGKRDAALMMKTILTSPKRATSIKKTLQSKNRAQESNENKRYSAEEGLALMVSSKLTKNQYITLRQGALEKGVNLYPSYHMIAKSKKLCYPQPSQLQVSFYSPLLSH